jgi:hypothetical protein
VEDIGGDVEETLTWVERQTDGLGRGVGKTTVYLIEAVYGVETFPCTIHHYFLPVPHSVVYEDLREVESDCFTYEGVPAWRDFEEFC